MSSCECGCGQATRIPTSNDAANGYVKGRPLRYLRGHNPQARPRPPLGARDYDEVDKGYETPCWVRRGCTNHHGYSEVKINGRKSLAHRAMYEQANGPVPPGLQIDHLCRVRNCIRPDHMEPVTPAENSRRGTRWPKAEDST